MERTYASRFMISKLGHAYRVCQFLLSNIIVYKILYSIHSYFVIAFHRDYIPLSLKNKVVPKQNCYKL